VLQENNFPFIILRFLTFYLCYLVDPIRAQERRIHEITRKKKQKMKNDFFPGKKEGKSQRPLPQDFG